MNTLIGLLYLSAILLITTGLTIGLTFAPCYSSLCSEDFFPVATRLHIATFYALVASIGVVLLLRACSPTCRRISGHYLTRREVPILDKRISVGGLALSIWIVGITLATTGFWFTAEYDFWGLRTKPFDWADAQIRLTVTGLIGHHADILLGLVLIPVSRNSVLGRTFALHQSTLLYAHKLVAYLLFVAVLAHGTAAYVRLANQLPRVQSLTLVHRLGSRPTQQQKTTARRRALSTSITQLSLLHRPRSAAHGIPLPWEPA